MIWSSLLQVAVCLTPNTAITETLDTPVRFTEAWEAQGPSGLVYAMPPATIVSLEHWKKIDDEVQRLQGVEISLRAQNDFLRRPKEDPVLSWVILASVSLGTGLAIGLWLDE